MTVQWLIQWWNLIFVLPLGLALMYLGLYTVSGITFGDADMDHDFDADSDFDADHDLGADADHDVDGDHNTSAEHDADADGDADSDHDAEADDAAGTQISAAAAAISWLGVGRVPLSILLMVALMTWGATGLICSAIASGSRRVCRVDFNTGRRGRQHFDYAFCSRIHRHSICR